MAFSSFDKLYRVHNWFDKRAGKLSLAVGAALLIKNTYMHLFPQSFCLAEYGSVTVDTDELGESVRLVHDTCAEVGINPKSVFPFVVEGLEVKSAGFGLKHYVLGVPRNFHCSNTYEVINLDAFRKIRRQFLAAGSTKLHKPTQNEIDLASAFVLTENAKKFQIIKHIKYLKDKWTLVEAVISPVFVAAGYFTYRYGPTLLKQNRSFLIVNIVGFWIICKLSKYMFQVQINDYLDDSVSAISKEYSRGGQEYYEGIVSGHKALRLLFGRRGERMFTENGDLAGQNAYNVTYTIMISCQTFLSKSVKEIIAQQESDSKETKFLEANPQTIIKELVNIQLISTENYLKGLHIMKPLLQKEFSLYEKHGRFSKGLVAWMSNYGLNYDEIKKLMSNDCEIKKNSSVWLLLILRITSILERFLRDLCKDTTCPFLLKDILRMDFLRDIFGEFIMKILQMLTGSPLGVNLRNLSWHGFLAADEVPVKTLIFLMSICNNIVDISFAKKITLKPSPLLCKKRYYEAFKMKFKEKTIPQLSNSILELIEKSPYTVNSFLPHFELLIKLYMSGDQKNAIIMFLPLFENTLRIVFAFCNDCPERVKTAQSSEFYTTLDDIFSPQCDKHQNKLVDLFGENFMEFLLDMFEMQDGPRIRDHISHAETDLKHITKDFMDILFCSMIYIAYPPYDLTIQSLITAPVRSFHEIFNDYCAMYHPFSIIKSKCDKCHEQLFTLTTNIKSNNFDIESNMLPNLDALSGLLCRKLRTLYRGNKNTLAITTQLNKIMENCLRVLENMILFAKSRVELLNQMKLRSRQRNNFRKFLIEFPKICKFIAKVTEFTSKELYNLTEKVFSDSNLKQLKELLKICENLVSNTSLVKNKWDEAASLCFTGTVLLPNHMAIINL